MFHELKIQGNFLLLPEKSDRKRFGTLPQKTKIAFSKKRVLKKQVWENARKKGWLKNQV